MRPASIDLHAPVFDAFGFAFSVQIMTLAHVYGVDLEQTSARHEEPAFVVRAAGLAIAGQPQRVPGAVVLRIEPDGGGRFRVWLRVKAPEPIRCTKLLLRGLAAPLEIVEDNQTRGAIATAEILAHPMRLPPLLLRCGGEPLAVRFEDRRMRKRRFSVAIERTGARAGQGVLEITHEAGTSRFAREQEAPPCVFARGDAVRGI